MMHLRSCQSRRWSNHRAGRRRLDAVRAEILRRPRPRDRVRRVGEAFAVRGLPVIMGISMFIQQKMSPMGGDPRQAQMMLYLMPVMFTFIFWGMPSGLVLYWLVNNVLQIGHQYRMNRGLGLAVGAGKEER